MPSCSRYLAELLGLWWASVSSSCSALFLGVFVEGEEDGDEDGEGDGDEGEELGGAAVVDVPALRLGWWGSVG
jgi:hypothetical protein